MSNTIIDTKEKLLADKELLAQIKKAFDLHKHNQEVLCLVKNGECTIHLDKFQEVVSKAVANFGGAIIRVSRKEVVAIETTETTELSQEQKDALVDAVENLYEKPVEVPLVENETEEAITENPFADETVTAETEESPKSKRTK